MPVVDRLQELVEQNVVCGIDFVDVHDSQVLLHVYFFSHDSTPQANQILTTLVVDDIEIYAPFGSDTLPRISADLIAWQLIDGRTVLAIHTTSPGDFSQYRLRINHAGLDHYFNDVSFSFKANCKSDLDCEPQPPNCDAGDKVDFPINYLARDFSSYRDALFEFASQRYPQWEDRLEADVGVMTAEVISALGDELAFYQDKIAQEAYLETAVQRRSIRRHAQLVDYWPHDGLGASGWLVVEAHAGEVGQVIAGTGVQALSDSGESINYEIGRGLRDTVNAVSFNVNSAINQLLPHCWDEDDRCLARGAVSMFLVGHWAAELAFDDPTDDPKGKWVVISVQETKSSPCPNRHLIRITGVIQKRDEILSQDITQLTWEAVHALPSEMEYEQMVVYANVLPITAGRLHEHRFVIGEEVEGLGLPAAEAVQLTRTIERRGNNDNTEYYQTLPDIEENQLVFLNSTENLTARSAAYTPNSVQPEVVLQEVEFSGISWSYLTSNWDWRRSLLGVNSSQSTDKHFSLEHGTWGRVVGYWRDGIEKVYYDYLANIGKTISFGNGEFGRVPAQGSIFSIRYRLGNGSQANVAPEAISRLSEPSTLIESVFNPFTLDNGLDPESDIDIRRFAPQAFRTVSYRAVLKEDYAEATERLNWVHRAGADERWTGSWLSTFVTPDPLSSSTSSSSEINPEQAEELCDQMARFRQAGREVFTFNPKFADLDLAITICANATVYAGDVKSHLLNLLVGRDANDLSIGYFADRSFTFGTPLRRAQLEATIHSCPGVRAVTNIQIRRRGWFDWREFTELSFTVGMDEVIRLENDSLHPSRGSLKLVIEGGS